MRREDLRALRSEAGAETALGAERGQESDDAGGTRK